MAKIIIVGGSLGGLFAANILLRQGHDVTLLEKAMGSLDGRGAGIVTHAALADALRQAGVEVDETLGVAVTQRVTLGSDGQSLGMMELPQILTSWSRLYHMLKEAFPVERYVQGKAVKTVSQTAEASSSSL
jgi:2-polyprenyl-6-methoxyphenol hydroxylase-like FAD-dependent oxidoreductase